MATWPVSLPQSFLVEGYSEQKTSQVLRSEVSAGPPKQRRRFSAAYINITGRMFMDDAQITTLEAFFENTLFGGSIEFEFPHPRTGETVNVLFPGGVAPVYTRLDSEHYYVDLQLEVQPGA